MIERRTTMEPAPMLGAPLPDAEPAPGCANCTGWACRRDIARQANDFTRVSDCNVMIRRCTH